jgi:tetratricopeptide (TPR) repeat protein
MLVLGAKVNTWGRFVRRWWWLALAPLILILVLGVNERRKNQEYENAVRAFQEDRLNDGHKLIQQFLKTWPDHGPGHLLAARLDRLLGNYAGAEKHLNECKRLGGMTGDLQVENLLLRAMNGEYAAVEKGLHELLAKDDPRSALILETLSHCHRGVMRYNTAMPYLQTWLKKEPDSIRALHLRAFMWERLENRERAKEDYKRVLTLAPGNRHSRVSLVELLLADKNIEEAAEQLAILKENPEHSPGELMAFARFELLQGNLDEAREYLDALLAEKPNHPGALFERGMLTRDLPQAEGFFRKALKGNENYLQARYQLYTNLFRQGRTKEAEAEKATYLTFRQDEERLLKLLPEADRSGNPDVLAEAGAILLRGGDHHQGTQLLYRALHLNSNHKKSHELLADYFEKTKQTDKADYHRRRASKKSP